MNDPTTKWRNYTAEQYNQLSEKEKHSIFIDRIEDLQKFFGITKSGRITYDQIKQAQTWVLKRFVYKSDDYMFNKEDFWDTEAFKKMLLQGYLQDDCDGFGYAILGLLYRVFRVPKRDLYRVACLTETQEGHFVVQVRDVNGIVYQVENRIRIPRSVKYMKDKGYTYLNYSPMTRVDSWFSAPRHMAEEIYKTPNDLASDKAQFSITKAFRLDKSRSLINHWTTVTLGGITTAFSTFTNAGSQIVSTLQANQSNLAQFISPTNLGILMVVLGLIGVYLRTVTDKDIEMKAKYDE